MPEQTREVCVSKRRTPQRAHGQVQQAKQGPRLHDGGFWLRPAGASTFFSRSESRGERWALKRAKNFIIDFHEANGRPFAGSSCDKFY
jgi:hypothetical protein